MNSSAIYDRNLFKTIFQDIYNDPNITYRFPINNRFFSDIINKWKFITNRFSKSSVLDNKYDYNNNLILRVF